MLWSDWHVSMSSIWKNIACINYAIVLSGTSWSAFILLCWAKIQGKKLESPVASCLVLRRFLGFSTVVARKDDGKASKTQRHEGKQSQDDCCKWWGTVIRLTGSSGNALSYSLECDREVLNEMALADILCFCGWYDIPPLDATTLLAFLSTDFCSD